MAGVARLLWPGNSPDLNAIEPAWFWIKRRTTAQGAPTTKAEMEKRWLRAWKDLPQETIQAWVERIPHHIQEIIRLQGGNEYEEGIQGFKRSWKGDRVKGKLSSRAYLDPALSALYKPSAPISLPIQLQKRQVSLSDSEVEEDSEAEGLWDTDAEERWDEAHA
jgi:hypothetical protein